eukprot:7208523-Prymnesium_polylepis.1
MDATPIDLTSGTRNIYKQIAISLKGGELREVGLSALAAQLTARVACAPIADKAAHSSRSCCVISLPD